jgi:hypothetical protein
MLAQDVLSINITTWECKHINLTHYIKLWKGLNEWTAANHSIVW